MADRFVCSWEKPDSPTRAMSHAEMTAYYKANRVKGDCAFALRPGTRTPDYILAQWRALLASIEARKGKESPAHRKEVERIRAEWRAWSEADSRARRQVLVVSVAS